MVRTKHHIQNQIAPVDHTHSCSNGFQIARVKQLFLSIIAIFPLLIMPIDSSGQCEPNPDYEFDARIIARSSGSDLEAPLKPGEEIFIKVDYISLVDTNMRITHGVVPTFGPGWNLSNIDFNSFYATYAYHASTWISSQNDCPPSVKRDIASLCTYIDINGNMQLCNVECETCPCNEGLIENDILPSGWFWPFAPSSCTSNSDCLLQQSWGPWGPYSNLGKIPFTLNILLTVDTFPNIDNCELRKDLTIGFQEIFDDYTGCWEGYENYVRDKLFTPNWHIDCSLPVESNKFNILKVNFYHDENQDGVKNDTEPILPNISNFEVIGESIIDHSEYLNYCVLSGNEYTVICDNDNFSFGWTLNTEDTIHVDFPEGIYEQTVEFGIYKTPTSNINHINSSAVLVYPNPVRSILTIELPSSKHEIKLTATNGKLIWQKITNNGTLRIDTRQLSNGVYYLNVHNILTGTEEIHKIIKY